METPIKIYYHVYAVNHYLDIIREQLECIKESGLYEECEEINIGFLGTKEALEKARDVFIFYPKIKYIIHDEDPNKYEFHTLRMLKGACDTAKEKFYGIYIHTKGVSYIKPEDVQAGKVWRDYLMKWVVSDWRINYKALNMKFAGYDICSVKIIPARVSPSNRTHASGNMWMFNSEYIKSLIKIESIENANRFEAEMWAFSGQPIIFMPCNLFIDYLNRQKSYRDFADNYSELNQFCLL